MNSSTFFGQLYNEKHIESIAMVATICSPFALLVNLYGLYAIVFHSARYLEVIKLHLVFHQVTLIILDFLMFDVVKPVLFLPVTAGIPTGFVKNWSPDIWMYLFGGILCFWPMTGSTALQIIVYKHQNLWPPGSRWTLSRRSRFLFCVYVNVTAATTASVTLVINGLNCSQTKEKMKHNDRAFLAHLLDQANVLAIDIDSPSFLVFQYGMLHLLGIFVFAIVVFPASTFQGLRRQRAQISQKTYEMQKKFLNILLIQLFIPLIFSFGTAVCGFCIVLTETWVPIAFNTVLFSLAGLHGFVGTVLCVALNKCYRAPVIRMLIYPFVHCKRKSGNVKVVDQRSISFVPPK